MRNVCGKQRKRLFALVFGMIASNTEYDLFGKNIMEKISESFSKALNTKKSGSFEKVKIKLSDVELF